MTHQEIQNRIDLAKFRLDNYRAAFSYWKTISPSQVIKGLVAWGGITDECGCVACFGGHLINSEYFKNLGLMKAGEYHSEHLGLQLGSPVMFSSEEIASVVKTTDVWLSPVEISGWFFGAYDMFSPAGDCNYDQTWKRSDWEIVSHRLFEGLKEQKKVLIHYEKLEERFLNCEETTSEEMQVGVYNPKFHLVCSSDTWYFSSTQWVVRVVTPNELDSFSYYNIPAQVPSPLRIVSDYRCPGRNTAINESLRRILATPDLSRLDAPIPKSENVERPQLISEVTRRPKLEEQELELETA